MQPASGQGLVPLEGARVLTAAEFQGLAQVLPEAEWFANIATTRLYDRRKARPEDSPICKVAY